MKAKCRVLFWEEYDRKPKGQLRGFDKTTRRRLTVGVRATKWVSALEAMCVIALYAYEEPMPTEVFDGYTYVFRDHKIMSLLESTDSEVVRVAIAMLDGLMERYTREGELVLTPDEELIRVEQDELAIPQWVHEA